MHDVCLGCPVPVEDQQQKCSNEWCHRVRRKGKLYCSRCTYKGTEAKLRDTLPGTTIPEAVLFKASREPNSTYIYAGVQEGMRAATHSPETKEEIEQAQQLLATISGETYYNRKQVSRMTGVSVTTICRFEAKGLTPRPKKLVHSGQLIYTNENVEAIKAFISQQVDVEYKPRVSRARHSSDQQATEDNDGKFNLSVNAVKKLGKGSIAGKKLNRVVASKLGSLIR